MPETSILLLETDPAAGESIRAALVRAGYTMTSVLDVTAVIRGAADHQLVIIDAVGPEGSAPDACREIHSAPGLSGMPVLCISQSEDIEERIRFLEAGADDVIARPFDARELEARVEALLLRFQRSQDRAAPSSPGSQSRRSRRVVAVFSPKGGVGTTTIAVNIAILANQFHPQRALILDLDLQFGTVATHLNLPLQHSLAELVRDEEALRDPELLRTYISIHRDGLQVIGAAGSPEYAQLVTVKHVDRLLTTLASSFEAVVVDAGSTLDERTLTVFELADSIVVPITAELGALRAVRTMLDYLNATGSTMTKALFVLNHMFPKEPLKTSDVETALGTTITAQLPYDAVLYVKAINEGVPLIVGSPRANAADRLSRLAGRALAGEKGTADTAPGRPRRGLRLCRRRG